LLPPRKNPTFFQKNFLWGKKGRFFDGLINGNHHKNRPC
jgi:hypothetical protein